MKRIRVIPVLLLKNGGLVKTVRFKDDVYIGDPINAVKIFNEKEVDEIVILNISATPRNESPDLGRITDIASECFMPMCYGGGITKLDEIKKVLSTGVEKVSLNSSAFAKPDIISEAANYCGSQSIVVSIDVKKDLLGRYQVFSKCGKQNTKRDPVEFAKEVESRGAGEILLTSMDQEGRYTGYDQVLINKVSHSVNIPVIANGGARNVDDFAQAVENGASAVAAGSMFVFHGKLKGVLINFPSQELLEEKLYSGLK